MGQALTPQHVAARLADAELDLFTTREVAELLQIPPQRASRLARRLMDLGLARRIGRGRYGLLEPTQWLAPDEAELNWYRVAAQLAHLEKYFLAYYTALELHGMLQHPLRTVFVAVPRPQRTKVVGPMRFRFIGVGERFFGFGPWELEPGRSVNLADLERAFVDAVDRPDLCGGIEEVFRGFVRRARRLDRDRLLHYVLRFDRPVVTKRLGLLLELTGEVDPAILWELEAVQGRLKRYVPLDPTRPVTTRAGIPLERRWEVAVNLDLDRLRRVSLT